jgi:4-hydroxythreonine-4-phosphate dehydrogenase
MHIEKHKPVIGVTLGDFNGVGPELILKTLSDTSITKLCTPVVYGSSRILSKYKKLLGLEEHHFNQIKNLDYFTHKKTNIINCWDEDYEIEPGKATAIAGKCAFVSLSMATDDLKKGNLDAIVTSPINKQNIQSNEFKFIGHTEYLQAAFDAANVLMFMVASQLKVALVTMHLPIEKVKENVTSAKIAGKLDLILHSLKHDFGIAKPKIAVLGLNPHAGDNGTIGNEELEIIHPVIAQYKQKGELVFGTFPADGFFAAQQHRKFDAVLAMYHDQGLIPFKMIAFEDGVNFTAGLKVVRTSPDHGTAYNIAGKGIAHEGSFRSAIFTAIDILKSRQEYSLVAHRTS